MLDVRMTEADLPLFFGLAASLVTVRSTRAPESNIEKLTTTSGALPIGVPDVEPRAARAWFIDESNGGAVHRIRSAGEVGHSDGNGLTVWRTTEPLVPVTAQHLDPTTTRIGLRVALSGSASTTTLRRSARRLLRPDDRPTGIVLGAQLGGDAGGGFAARRAGGS